MNMQGLKSQIKETIKNEWKNLADQYPKFNVDEAYLWIKWWGKGGGQLSTEVAIQEAIDGSKGDTQGLINIITSDMYYEWGNCAHYFDVVSVMISECIKNEKGE